MPQFSYTAVDTQGRMFTGQTAADSEGAVVRYLASRNATAVNVVAAREARSAFRLERSIPKGSILEITEQLAASLTAGVPLVKTLEVIGAESGGGLGRIIGDLKRRVEEGSSFSDALQAHSDVFSASYRAIVQAGERAGLLSECLTELAGYLRDEIDLRRRVIGALTYPAIVIVALIAACIVLLVAVVPMFQQLFSQYRATLPLPTRLLLGTSQALRDQKDVLLLSMAGITFLLWWFRRSDQVRRGVQRACLGVPILGRILKTLAVTRFTRMMALLTETGLMLDESLRLSAAATVLPGFRDNIESAAKQVRKGRTLMESLESCSLIDPLTRQMTRVGEETGELGKMFNAAWQHHDGKLRAALGSINTVIEPVLTIVLGLVMLFVALAIFLPLWQINDLLLKG